MRPRGGRAVVLGGLLVVGGGAVLANLLFGGGGEAGPERCPGSAAVGAEAPAAGTSPVALTLPVSPDVPVGTFCRVRLPSACAAVVDFDGSFWVPLQAGWAAYLPLAPAEIRLVSPDRAVLRTGTGGHIALVRAAGAVTVRPCPVPVA